MKTRAQYVPSSGLEQTEVFFDSVAGQAHDSSREVAVKSALDSVKNEAGASLPASVQKFANILPETGLSIVLDAAVHGMEIYKRDHGVYPTADVMDAALSQGFSAAHDPKSILGGSPRVIMDGAGSSLHSDNLSAMPNRIVVAITAALAEAIPFAAYLPADIGSNQAKLGIVSHVAGSAFGDYPLNKLMDGINIGDNYFSSERTISLSTNGGAGPFGGAFLTTAGGAAVPVLRYRTFLSVNGYPVAFESTQNSQAATNSISGVVTLAGTDYALAGTINIGTGAVTAVSSNPALPAGTVLQATAFIDFESKPELTPEILTNVQTYDLYATPWRGKAKQTIDSKTQYNNEIGVDLLSESIVSMRNQIAMERHYRVLATALLLASKNNVASFDFDKATQIAQKDRRQIWLNLLPVLGRLSQQMAEDTMDHGITHLYVTKGIAADFLGLPTELFEPSGLTDRPGIFRIGRLFGRYDVYYTPKVLVEATGTGQILCFGRSTQPSRNPFVLGDAVSPIFLPLAINDDLKSGSAFYGRNFTSVNPHLPSSKGVALINVTNM